MEAPVRKVVRIILIAIVFLLLGMAAGLIWNNADDKSSGPPFVHDRLTPVYCIEVSGRPCDVKAASRWSASKFRAGALGHQRFNPKALFTNPVHAKALILAAIRREYAKPKNAVFRAIPPGQRLQNTLKSANCVRNGGYHPYSTGYQVCSIEGRITRHDIQKIGAISLCGAGVALMIPSGGSTTEIAVGSGACAWGFWMTADPG